MSRLIRTRLADERGFTLVIVLGVLTVIMGFTAAAFAIADNDTHLAKRNQDDKAAYAAAEAGVNAYLAQLNGNPSFWSNCDDPTGVTAPGVAPEWQSVGAGTTARYTIELLPRLAACDKASPDASMINADGTLRVRVTGAARPDVAPPARVAAKRSIVLTLRRDGFLDYLLWTDYESLDPRVTSSVWNCDYKVVGRTSPATAGAPFGSAGCFQTRLNATPPNDTSTLGNWADANCNTYWRDGRNAGGLYPGEIRFWDTSLTPDGWNWTSYSTWFRNLSGLSAAAFPGLTCEEASFGTADTVGGALHTNDSLSICGGPIDFGRDGNDRIEVVAGDTQTPWRQGVGSCAGAAQPSPGAWTTGSHGAQYMEPPPANTALRDVAAYSFSGGTKIVFGAGGPTKMAVTNQGVTTTYDQPADGVIWVGNSGSCPSYNAMFPFVTTGATSQPCGDVAVEGTYSRNITIGAENDIVITDDVQRDPDSTGMLGLIGGQFVRIDHPSTLGTGLGSLRPWPSCTNTSTATDDLTLDAAILALNGSFLLDRVGCGAAKGDLNVTGAIAQRHRGLVGVSAATPSGYTKNYAYDDRLKYRTPPNFLDPVNSSWHVIRQVEQAPPAYDCVQTPKPPGCP
jgi:hypothetical protein